MIFKEKLIENKENLLLTHPGLDDFFIHSFKDDLVQLKLPLPPHRKTVHDFVFVLKGEMTKTIGLKKFVLRPKSFLFTPKNAITTTENVSDDLIGFYCHFSDGFPADNPIFNLWSAPFTSQNFLKLTAEQVETFQLLLERMMSLYRDAGENNLRLIGYSLSTLLAEIAVITEENISKTFIHPIVSKFNKAINKNFKVSRQVKFYADLVHVSPNHLNKVVKQETGKSASEVINELCILEAKVLLTQTSLEINEIALELGFEDISYFSRFFKKHCQISPSNYRKKIDLS